MGIFKREEKKVRETIELYANGIIDKDIDMLMSLIALDEDFLLINQDPYEKVIGAKKFFIGMKDFLETVDEVDININWMFLSVIDNMAWANTEMLFAYRTGEKCVEENRSVTFVLERRRGDWYIVHIINSIGEVFEETETAEEKMMSEETEVYTFGEKSINIEVDDTADDNG